MKPELRVALLGQGFMGKAHSNAYCQAPHFFDLPFRVRRQLLCGRDAAALAAMHDKAHHACFIANSVKTTVTVEGLA